MPDITMCENHNCPSKEHCYRYKARPSLQWQSICHLEFDELSGKCEYFMEMYKYGTNNSMDYVKELQEKTSRDDSDGNCSVFIEEENK